MGRAEDAASLTVEVAHSAAPREVTVVQVRLPAGATLGDALLASRLLESGGDLPPGCAVGLWGRRRPLDTPLRDGDRVEVWRPLLVDPKVARRLRYKGQPDARTLRGADGRPKKQERPGRGRS